MLKENKTQTDVCATFGVKIMKSNNEIDQVLDKVTGELRNEEIDSEVIDQAARRAWQRIAAAEVNHF